MNRKQALAKLEDLRELSKGTVIKVMSGNKYNLNDLPEWNELEDFLSNELEQDLKMTSYKCDLDGVFHTKEFDGDLVMVSIIDDGWAHPKMIFHKKFIDELHFKLAQHQNILKSKEESK